MLDTGSPLLSRGTVITVLESVVEVAPNHLGPNQCGGYTEFIRFKHAGLGLCLGKHRFGARTKKIIFTTPNVVLSQNIAVRHATTRNLSFSGETCLSHWSCVRAFRCRSRWCYSPSRSIGRFARPACVPGRSRHSMQHNRPQAQTHTARFPLHSASCAWNSSSVSIDWSHVPHGARRVRPEDLVS